MGILWPHSNTVARTNADRRAPGALAHFFEARTATPRTTYQDAALTTPHAHPVVADAHGRFPAVFIDFGAYRERVKTAGGTQLWDTDDIPNPAPTDPGEGVPAVKLLQTGMTVFEFINDTRPGFVRANGRTIGNGASGASERANADCSALYEYLYGAMSDALCPVEGGRGANAAADFAANKKLTLPDLRGAVPGGLDTMGNAAASLLGSAPVVAGSTMLPGSTLGANTHTLSSGQMPSHTHAGTSASNGAHTHTATTTSDGAHTHSGTTSSNGDHNHAPADGTSFLVVKGGGSLTGPGPGATAATNNNTANAGAHTHAYTTDSQGTHTHTLTTSSDGAHTHTFTSDATGGGGAHNNLPRAVLGTWYIKL